MESPEEPAGEDDAVPDAYQDLIERYEQISTLGDAVGVLRWDQQVMMPEGGTPARSKQVSTLSALSHERLVDGTIETALDALDREPLSTERQANVREIEREHARAARVDGELIEEIAEATTTAHETWVQAKAEDDFEAFAPTLERVVELKREYAAQIDPERDPYAVLFEEFEPYLGLDTAERVLERLRSELLSLIDEIAESDVEMSDPFEGSYDTEIQERLARDALDTLGYDWEHGRLDTAPHPFSTGNQFDARVTTRFTADAPLDALTSTIHEFGHANYTLGLPRDSFATPLGASRDLTVHESQSRFWENHVARSKPFWEQFLPTVIERFPQLSDTTPEELYRSANEVSESNPIRVEADELTYHMHIILRFEIERDLIRGDLEVEELPQLFNEKMESYLGITPESDADGCLQDIHWSQGSFGYFPTYTLGSVLAAQLDDALRRDLEGVDEQIRSGEFDEIRAWHTEQVHRHGARYTTDDLVREATGSDYAADPFLDYVTEKYGGLYDL